MLGMKKVRQFNNFGSKAIHNGYRFGMKNADMLSSAMLIGGQPELALGVEMVKKIGNALEKRAK